LSIPAAHQRLSILPSRHRFTFLAISRDRNQALVPTKDVQCSAVENSPGLTQPGHGH
jgi:hypothetical protein